MERLFLPVSFLFVLLTGFSKPEESTGSGIQFFKGDFRAALKESQASGRPVFIDVYADWCGTCKKLRKTSFRDTEVGAYFNKNFINLTIDGETPEGSEIRRMYDVSSYPTLLIIDGRGKILARSSGFMKPYILINFGRRVVP